MSVVTASPENAHYSFPPAHDPTSTMAGRPLSGGAAPSSVSAQRPVSAPAPFGAVATRRRSGPEIVATVVVGATVLVTAALLLTYSSSTASRYDIVYSLARIVLGGVWHVVTGFVLCLRRRAVTGSAVAVIFFVPSAAANVIDVLQRGAVMGYGNIFSVVVAVAAVVAVALLVAFVVVLVNAPRTSRPRPRSLQLSEAAVVCITVGAGAFFVNGSHALMGYPLFGDAQNTRFVTPVALYMGSAILLVPGIAALAVPRFRRAHAVYAALVSVQAVAWMAVSVMYNIWLVVDFFHSNLSAALLSIVLSALPLVLILVFAFLVWAQPVKRWFAGTRVPATRPSTAGVTVLAAVPAATVPATAVPQRILGADGRVHTVVAAAPAPVMGGAPGSAGGAFAPAAPPAQFPQAAVPVVPAAPAIPSGAAAPVAAPAPVPPSQFAAPAAAASGSAAPSGAAPAAPPPVGYGSSSGPAPSST